MFSNTVSSLVNNPTSESSSSIVAATAVTSSPSPLSSLESPSSSLPLTASAVSSVSTPSSSTPSASSSSSTTTSGVSSLVSQSSLSSSPIHSSSSTPNNNNNININNSELLSTNNSSGLALTQTVSSTSASLSSTIPVSEALLGASSPSSLNRSHSLSTSAFYRPDQSVGSQISQQQQHSNNIINNNNNSATISGHRSQAQSFSSGTGSSTLDQYFNSNSLTAASSAQSTLPPSFLSPQTPIYSIAAAVSAANTINSIVSVSGSLTGNINSAGNTIAHRSSAVSSPAHSSSSGRATPTPTLTPLAPLAPFSIQSHSQLQQQQNHHLQRHASFSFAPQDTSFISGNGSGSCLFNSSATSQQSSLQSGLAPKRSFSNIYNGSSPSIAKRSLVSHLQGGHAHASEGSDDSGFVSASSPTSGNLQQQQQQQQHQNSLTMMSTSPSLLGGSGQYGHIGTDAASVAAATATSYNFDDYSALPFSGGWSITNLDHATAAAMAAAAVSQSPTALHAAQVSHPGLPLQMPPLQQSSLSAAAAVSAISNNQQQQQQQQQQSQQASPSGTSLGLSGQSLHSGNGQGLMSLKDIKLFQNYPSKSVTSTAELRILKQPETHHRARYMTEGSRGTIKDRTGRGYPVVQLAGYNKGPVKLQCFIGHDQKIGEPHLFYQACEVSGKTPYTFVKIDGFNTIELELLPKNNMQAVFDCMGILKERNVDVERKVLRNRRRSQGSRPGVNATEEAKMIRNTNKSRSTHCRMVFRLILPDSGEIMQIVSDQILCTQPLGSPEIYKMSLRECDLKGGAELFVIGKNFHKDTKVIFESVGSHWRKLVSPQKEFLNSTHLVCQVPPYDGLNVNCLPLINVDVSVHCNHKNSDPMKFIYTNGFSSGIGGLAQAAANGKRSSLASDAFECTNLNAWNGAAAAAAAASNDRRNSPETMSGHSAAAAAAQAAQAQAHSLVYFDPSQSQLAAAAAYLRESSVVANPIMSGNSTNALFLLERPDVLK